MRCRIVSFQLQTMRLVIPGVFFLTFGQIGSGALESNSMRKEGLCTKTSPQLPFDQGVQIHIQRVLALCVFHYCEFHYCDFSKKSLNLPYGLGSFISLVRFFGYFCPIWLMRIFSTTKSCIKQAKTICTVYSLVLVHDTN